jgi:hypothetical protein
MSTTVASANITAQNTFTTAVQLEGYFNLSLRGPTFTATTTVTVQRSIDNSTWVDVDTFTAPTEEYGFEPELMWYRVGVKSGEFTAADDINVRLGREFKDRH